jgi:ribosomal protein S19
LGNKNRKMTSEGNIMKNVQTLSRGFVRLFRNNVGTGWVGKTIHHHNGRVILENARPLDAGLCKGSSDLIGWTTVEITPEMVGKKVAVFTALEVKAAKGNPTDEQLCFIENVKKAGGIAEVVRSKEEAEKKLHL